MSKFAWKHCLAVKLGGPKVGKVGLSVTVEFIKCVENK